MLNNSNIKTPLDEQIFNLTMDLLPEVLGDGYYFENEIHQAIECTRNAIVKRQSVLFKIVECINPIMPLMAAMDAVIHETIIKQVSKTERLLNQIELTRDFLTPEFCRAFILSEIVKRNTYSVKFLTFG